MTIDELLASKNLTVEEWELHKDLIEDCRNNEAMIAESSKVARQSIERMGNILDTISVKMLQLSIALSAIIGEAEDISLRLLPENRFHRE